MKDKTEIIVLVVVLVLIYTRPSSLVRFSSTFLGKLILLVTVVVASLISPLSGLLIATLMVLYTEQNYEGFKEGFLDGSTSLIVNGEYATGATDIMLEYDIGQHDKITEYVTGINDGNYDIINDSLFDAQTRIKSAAVEGLQIELSSGITIPNSQLTPGSDEDIIIQLKESGENTYTDVATGKFQIDETNTNDGINIFHITTDKLTYGILQKNNDVAEITDIVGDFSPNILRVKLGNNTYEIKSTKLIISVTISKGIKTGVSSTTTDRDVTIVEHSHTHGHVDGFEGMDGEETAEKETDDKETDEKEDEETDEAVKNIMDKLDIGGIIDEVKDKTTKTEGFFSGERKNVNEVAGAFAGELYESEITGITKCNTTICERIHREEQLIRPVNSNEELPRV